VKHHVYLEHITTFTDGKGTSTLHPDPGATASHYMPLLVDGLGTEL